MAARQIDWSKLGWCMTQNVQVGSASVSMFANGGARFGQFKGASDAVSSAYASANKRSTSINFDDYKKALPSQAKWISEMEAQYNATKVPKPVDTLSETVDADDSKVATAIDNSIKALDEAAAGAAGEVATLKKLPPMRQMTYADTYRAFPELNPFVKEEMERHFWEIGYNTAEDEAAILDRKEAMKVPVLNMNTDTEKKWL